jgi:hypothetical protein
MHLLDGDGGIESRTYMKSSFNVDIDDAVSTSGHATPSLPNLHAGCHYDETVMLNPRWIARSGRLPQRIDLLIYSSNSYSS